MRLELTPFDKLHEECGIFGVYGHPEAANLAYLGLHALQHRGQEGSGIVSSDGRDYYAEKGPGLVLEVFDKSRLDRLPGRMAIGHNRYSTAGGSHEKNLQPFLINFARGHLALAHNGNLVNAQALRSELEAYGAIFQSTADTEVIIHLIAHSRQDSVLSRIIDALGKVRGAFSLLFLCSEGLIAVRDPFGVRPLSLGRLRDGWVVSSESVAFNLVEADYVRDLEPGELVVINDRGLTSYHPFPPTRQAQCVFEHVYFSRPDSRVFGHNVYSVRKQTGVRLAKESPAAADVVIPVPDSGIPAALGFAEGSGVPFEEGLVRSHYIGRTFIEPQESIRHFGVRIKLSPIREVLEGRRVVVVDDSLVRGTTSRKLLKMLRAAGAKEVHLRIASPPIISPCFYGIDTPTRQELIATSHTVEETRKYIGADSLAYLSREGLFAPFGKPESDGASFCDACFSGKYPVPFTKEELVQLGLF
jgi:amidophosphoribosyltransferase